MFIEDSTQVNYFEIRDRAAKLRAQAFKNGIQWLIHQLSSWRDRSVLKPKGRAHSNC